MHSAQSRNLFWCRQFQLKETTAAAAEAAAAAAAAAIARTQREAIHGRRLRLARRPPVRDGRWPGAFASATREQNTTFSGVAQGTQVRRDRDSEIVLGTAVGIEGMCVLASRLFSTQKRELAATDDDNETRRVTRHAPGVAASQ